MPASADSFIPIIDGHTHIYRNLRRAGGEDEAARGALGLMDRLGMTLTILAPPPFPADRSESYGLPELARLVHAHPDRFAFTAGGESLNPMIQETPPGSVTSAVLGRFVEAAVPSGAATSSSDKAILNAVLKGRFDIFTGISGVNGSKRSKGGKVERIPPSYRSSRALSSSPAAPARRRARRDRGAAYR